jgi:competence protein ComEA
MIRNDEGTRKRIRKACIGIFLLLAAAGGIRNYLIGDKSADEILITQVQEPSIMIQEGITTSSQIDMPMVQEPVAAPEIPEAASEDTLISINHATQDELETLKGIGPTKALGIIGYREEYGEFKALEELTEVKGIGPATYAKIKDFIRL